MIRINRDFRDHVLREPDQPGVALSPEVDALEVQSDDLGENLLVVARRHTGSCLLARACCSPSSLANTSIAGRIRCIGTPAFRKAASTYASASPMNGIDGSWRRSGEIAVTTGLVVPPPC
jgi:hypothetical protein